ncbi:F box domain containing protein, partial [Entamoeba invadens IP1]
MAAKATQPFLDEVMHADINTYNPIKNTISPPLHCIQSYEKAENGFIKIRTIAYSCGKLESVKELFKNRDLFYSTFPEITHMKVLNNSRIECHSIWISDNQKQLYNFQETVIEGDNYVSRLETDYTPKTSVYYIFVCEKHLSGLKYTCEMKILNGTVTYRNFLNIINNQRIFVYYICERMNVTREGYILLNSEREFYQRMDQTALYPRLIYLNEFEKILTNEECTQIIFIGKVQHQMPLNTILSGIHLTTISTPFFPKIQTITENKKSSYLHCESPFLADGTIQTDIAFFSRIVEGNIFFTCHSVHHPLCRNKHTNKKFELVIAAEMFDVSPNGSVESNFYYQFYCPDFAKASPRKHAVMFMDVCNCFSAYRLMIEYNMQFPKLVDISDQLKVSRILLAYIIRVGVYIRKRKVLCSHDERNTRRCDKKVSNYLGQLDDKLLENIFSFLSLEDLMKTMETCKKWTTSGKYFIPSTTRHLFLIRLTI